MTRFARAKGSKASNERVPEQATSWHDMKMDILHKNELQVDDSKGSEKIFRNNVEKQDKSVKWSEFPVMDEKKHDNIKKKDTNIALSESSIVNKKNKKRKLDKKTNKKVKSVDDLKTNVDDNTLSASQNTQILEVSEETNNKQLKLNPLEKKQKSNISNKKLKLVDDPQTKVDDNTLSASQNTQILHVDEETNKKQLKKLKRLEKKHKSNVSNKKVRSVNDPQSIVNDNTLSASQNTVILEVDAETNKKQIKKLKRLEKKQESNVSNRKDVKANDKNKSNQAEYKRRKPNSEINKIFINGNEIEISYYDGFPIKKIDAERLKDLKKEMISRGLPRSEIAIALKLERRKAEKSLAREKKKVCFNCRNSGHTLSECPMLKSGPDAHLSETGICFKCGSTEHTHFECRVTRGDNFKFAQCFICKEQGHIARQCPDNSRGLYPNGGACRICGDVTHLKKDCPKFQSEQEENKFVAHTIDHQNIETLENETMKTGKKTRNLQKIIKF